MLSNANASVIQGLIAKKGLKVKADAKQCYGYAMLRLSNSRASLIQGLIALKGLKITLRLVLYKAW